MLVVHVEKVVYEKGTVHRRCNAMHWSRRRYGRHCEIPDIYLPLLQNVLAAPSLPVHYAVPFVDSEQFQLHCIRMAHDDLKFIQSDAIIHCMWPYSTLRWKSILIAWKVVITISGVSGNITKKMSYFQLGGERWKADIQCSCHVRIILNKCIDPLFETINL